MITLRSYGEDFLGKLHSRLAAHRANYADGLPRRGTGGWHQSQPWIV